MASVGPKLSQKDYLKKYLSGGADGKKKKKKKSKGAVPASRAQVKVIDDDVDISKLQQIDESALDLYELNEDAPQIAGIVDERPADVKALDQYKQGQRWKVLNNADGDGVSVSMSGAPQKAGSVSSVEVEAEFLVKPNEKDRRTGKQNRDRDISPPRRKRQEESDESPPRRRRQDDSDASPPRKRVHSDSDASPPRKGRRAGSNESPPRSKRQYKNNSDSRQKQHDKSFDSSSRRRHQNDSDASPPRRKQHKDSDVSPPRRKQYKDSDASPPRRKQYKNSDASPPRRKQHKNSSVSPGRKKSQDDSDTSPPRKRQPVQRQIEEVQVDSDASPPRRSNKRYSGDRDDSRAKIRQRKDDHRNPEGKMRKTLDGKAAGLQDAKNLKRELEDFKRREEKVFEKMDDSLSGRGATVVQRDRKTGLKRDIHKEQAEQRVKDEKEKKSKEKYTRWGKGLKQTEDQQSNLERDLYEMSKPLARYADDADLDAHYREQDREGDPMLEYLRNKNKDQAKAKVPIYQGSFPPNRYNIRPGYRWDGVDRSGGYEKKWFEARNAKKALEEEAYKWSTSDM